MEVNQVPMFCPDWSTYGDPIRSGQDPRLNAMSCEARARCLELLDEQANDSEMMAEHIGEHEIDLAMEDFFENPDQLDRLVPDTKDCYYTYGRIGEYPYEAEPEVVYASHVAPMLARWTELGYTPYDVDLMHRRRVIIVCSHLFYQARSGQWFKYQKYTHPEKFDSYVKCSRQGLPLRRKHPRATGYILQAYLTESRPELVIGPMETLVVPTGIICEAGEGRHFEVRPVEYLMSEFSVSITCWDTDFVGEVCVHVTNDRKHREADLVIRHRQELGQLVVYGGQPPADDHWVCVEADWLRQVYPEHPQFYCDEFDAWRWMRQAKPSFYDPTLRHEVRTEVDLEVDRAADRLDAELFAKLKKQQQERHRREEAEAITMSSRMNWYAWEAAEP